jgi:hypothetical protein
MLSENFEDGAGVDFFPAVVSGFEAGAGALGP